MKDVSQYSIKYGFGVTNISPWTPSNPHLGVDRPTPMRTPLLANNQLIAYTGNTGGVEPHHHLQKVVDNLVVNPNNGGFTIPTPAVVYDVGEKPKIGKYIRIRDASGVLWSHFHLDQILVKVGDKIGESMDYNTVRNIVMRMGKLGMLPEEQFTSNGWLNYHTQNAMLNLNYLVGLGDSLANNDPWKTGNYKAVNYDKDVNVDFVETKVYVKVRQ